MALDKLALIVVIAFAAVWCGIVLVGALTVWPLGLLVLIVFAIVGYFIYRVVRDRLSNAEDDYYEKNIDQ